jgi:hypothetical protein
MDVRDEIAARVEQLPPELQKEVLEFVTSVASLRPRGQSGASLRAFAGSLDPASAREMTRAIEDECERVDASQW